MQDSFSKWNACGYSSIPSIDLPYARMIADKHISNVVDCDSTGLFEERICPEPILVFFQSWSPCPSCNIVHRSDHVAITNWNEFSSSVVCQGINLGQRRMAPFSNQRVTAVSRWYKIWLKIPPFSTYKGVHPRILQYLDCPLSFLQELADMFHIWWRFSTV
jgi:hypothetical protein